MQKRQDFTSIEQQIDILKQRGLLFNSEESASDRLRKYGYYNIINGYKDNYVIKTDEGEIYKEGTTFEQIYSLFSLDHMIRNAIMIIMLDIEETLKTQAAYIIAENYTSDYVKYSDIRNYKNIQIKNQRFTLRRILDDLDKAYYSDKDPIRYHRLTYDNVPPWVLLKGVYFSTTINYIRFFKSAQKSEMIRSLLSVKDNITIDDYLKRYFSDLLRLFLEYRNLCAHGGRIYNFNSSVNLEIHDDLKTALNIPLEKADISALGKLTIALSTWKDQSGIYGLTTVIEKEVKRHCMSFPDDKDYLLRSMDIQDMKPYNFH